MGIKVTLNGEEIEVDWASLTEANSGPAHFPSDAELRALLFGTRDALARAIENVPFHWWDNMYMAKDGGIEPAERIMEELSDAGYEIVNRHAADPHD